MTGSPIYQRMGEHLEGERLSQMLEFWKGTPWIADVFTGSSGEDRSMEMRHWLHENFGPQAWPFGKNPRGGRWLLGGATIFGWTWIGFASEADMNAFFVAYPPQKTHEEEPHAG